MENQEEQKSLKYFLKQLQRYGRHRKVVKLFGKETQPSDIIVGEVHNIADTAEKPNRKLLVTVLREVYPDGSKGKLFSLFAFDKYANILKSNSSAPGSVIGICGADIDKSPIIDDDDHEHLPYRARLGLPKKNGSKFIFMMNSNSKEKETLPKIQRQNKSKQSSGSSKTKQNISKSSQVKSKEGPNTSETAAEASKSKREQKTSQSASSVTVGSERMQVQKPAETINRYQYLKLCDLKMAATKLSIYGVISRILRIRDNYAHLDIVDETLPADQTFKLHIFKGTAPSLPNITEGHIVRAHRLKTEEFQEQWDGRVFDARDVVMFPPEGTGKEGAVTMSKNFHFEDTDLERLTQLRQWIKEEYSRRPPSPTPTSREGSVCGDEEVTGRGYNSSVKTLAEIRSEGHYILYCKVVESRHKKGKTVLIVTDGTIPSDLITREEVCSADTRGRRPEDLRTVKVILKSETQMKLQDEFVKMVGLEAEMIVDAYSEKTCLAFVLRKIQNIKIIPPTHNQAKVISRRLQLKKNANHSTSTGANGASKPVLNGQEIEISSSRSTGLNVSGSSGMPQNRKRRINSESRESENGELERNSVEARSTGMQQRSRPSLSEEIPELKHQHRWHDPQGHSYVTLPEAEASRVDRNEMQGALFSTSTPMKNSEEQNSDEDNEKCEDIISLIYNLPEKRNVRSITQESRCEQMEFTRRPQVLSVEEKQSSSKDCEIISSSKQLRKVPLVPTANSKDGSELLKSLKQKARKRVYGESCANLDHNLDCSNNTIYDDGVQAVPNQMSYEKSQAQECLECSCLGTAEMMANMHQCLARIARVEPVTRDQENSQLGHVEEAQQLADSEEPSPTVTECCNHHGNIDVADLNATFNQENNRSDVTLVIEDDPITAVAGPSSYRGDLRERAFQPRASRNFDNGTSDDEDSDTSSACVYIAQNKSLLGKRAAENCRSPDVDRYCKYPKTSSSESVRDVQNENNSDDQKSTISESSASVASHWTEVQDSSDENPLPVTIRCIKSRGLEENEYLVEGVITQVEPSIRAGNLRKDFVSGYCSACNTFSIYSSLISSEGNSQERLCPQCPESKHRPVSLVFALKFHVVDKTNEELVVGLVGESGVDFFGVTVNRYLRDPQIRKQISDALQDLLTANDSRREPRKVRLYVQSFLDLSGMQYMIRKTYLCFAHGSE